MRPKLIRELTATEKHRNETHYPVLLAALPGAETWKLTLPLEALSGRPCSVMSSSGAGFTPDALLVQSSYPVGFKARQQDWWNASSWDVSEGLRIPGTSRRFQGVIFFLVHPYDAILDHALELSVNKSLDEAHTLMQKWRLEKHYLLHLSFWLSVANAKSVPILIVKDAHLRSQPKDIITKALEFTHSRSTTDSWMMACTVQNVRERWTARPGSREPLGYWRSNPDMQKIIQLYNDV